MRITTAFGNAFGRVVGFLPNLIAALVILAVGFFIAMVLERITRRLLSAVGLDRRPLARRWLGESVGIQRLPRTGGRIVYWVAGLITVGLAIDALNLAWLSAGFARVLAYLPNVLAAAAVVFVGYIAANFLYRETAARSAGTVVVGAPGARRDPDCRRVHGSAAARDRHRDRHHRLHGRDLGDGRRGRAGVRARQPRACRPRHARLVRAAVGAALPSL